MKYKSYFRVVAFSLALAIATSLLFVSPVMLCYAQGGYEGADWGGAGGGVSPAGLTFLGTSINSEGWLTEDVTAESFDGLGWLTIKEGTRALYSWGTPLYIITMLKMEDPPPPPASFKIIGPVYDFEPDGATFEPSATLTITYDPALLPEGVSYKCLVIAMWDKATGKWVILDSTVNTNTSTAQISHFTAFAILAGTAPAVFTVTDLAIVPGEVSIRGKVTISTLVNNTGYLSESYEVTLKINDVVVATEKVTLPGLASQKVTFVTAKDVTGTYSVDINGLAGTFKVREAPPAPSPPPAPAPPPPIPPPAEPFNWWFIGIPIASCMIIGMVIWLITSRRRA